MIDGKKEFKTEYWVMYQKGLGKGAQRYTNQGSRQVFAESQSKAKKMTRIWLSDKYRIQKKSHYKVTAKEVKH